MYWSRIACFFIRLPLKIIGTPIPLWAHLLRFFILRSLEGWSHCLATREKKMQELRKVVENVDYSNNYSGGVNWLYIRDVLIFENYCKVQSCQMWNYYKRDSIKSFLNIFWHYWPTRESCKSNSHKQDWPKQENPFKNWLLLKAH